MGNELRLPQIFNQIKNQTAIHSYDELKQKVSIINSAFQQSHDKIGLNLQLFPSMIRFEPFSWKKSTVKGSIEVLRRKTGLRIEEESNVERLPISKESIVLSYEDINTLHQQMKNLNQITSPTQRGFNSLKEKLHQPQKPTPNSLPTPSTPHQPLKQLQECCICFQKTPSMVLPCSHAFCDNCTVKYIIEAEEKRCPQCRHQIKGSRQSVERQIFTVIQDDQVFEQVKHDILQVLNNLNPRIVKNIQKLIENQ